MAELRRLPKYAQPSEKQKALIAFIESLDLSTKPHPTTKKPQLVNYADYITLNAMFNSCNIIAEKQADLSDRDVKAKAQTLVTSSMLSQNLAFIAGNVDGIIESMKNNIAIFGNEGNFASLTQAAEAWKSTSEEITKLAEQLKTKIEENLEKGYGTSQQIKAYNKQKSLEKKDEIKDLFFAKKKTVDEIATKLKIKDTFIQTVVNDLIDENIKENIKTSRNKLKITYQEMILLFSISSAKRNFLQLLKSIN